uniref:Knottins-like domain-containing protein n=1 Tax=Nelumbo nucifera TaxID=4432 RepID=A0A822ZKN8_NELNU|nr:TPA_asm: hypothetical protein HUJ06_002159 [Nelumbo nucifera]
MERKFLCGVLLLLTLLLASQEMVVHVDARMCDTPSQKFVGLCLIDRNCENVCKTEGFPAGHCEGLRRRCFCSEPCPP